MKSFDCKSFDWVKIHFGYAENLLNNIRKENNRDNKTKCRQIRNQVWFFNNRVMSFARLQA